MKHKQHYRFEAYFSLIVSVVGLCTSVSSGVVARVVNTRKSHLSEEVGSVYPAMLETTAAVHPGGSGGVVINAQGRMIGLVTRYTCTHLNSFWMFSRIHWQETVTSCSSLCLSCFHLCACFSISHSWPWSVATMIFYCFNHSYSVCSLPLSSSTTSCCKLCNIYMGTINKSNSTYAISLIILLSATVPK